MDVTDLTDRQSDEFGQLINDVLTRQTLQVDRIVDYVTTHITSL